MRQSILATLATAVLASSALSAEAAGSKCTPESIAGAWTRLTEGNTRMKAVWTFTADGKISCAGSECARLAGPPMAYLIKRSNIAIGFQKGTMSGTCVMTDTALFIGGGNAEGGVTFIRD